MSYQPFANMGGFSTSEMTGALFALLILPLILLAVGNCAASVMGLSNTAADDKQKKSNRNALTIISPNGVYYPVSYHSEKGLRPYLEDFSHMRGLSSFLSSQHATESAASSSSRMRSKSNALVAPVSSSAASSMPLLQFDHRSSIFSVYDGHGGAVCAKYCSHHLINNAFQLLTTATIPSCSKTKSPFVTSSTSSSVSSVSTSAIRNPLGSSPALLSYEAIAASLTEAFRITEQSFFETKDKSGTTAVVAAIIDNVIHVANAGDSRAIIVKRNGKVFPLSDDHKPNRPDELARIQALGGRVVFNCRWRVEGVLAVSRALGDRALKPFVSSVPDVMTHVIEDDDEFLVLASDGIYDTVTNEQVGSLLTKELQQSITLSSSISRSLSSASLRSLSSSARLSTLTAPLTASSSPQPSASLHVAAGSDGVVKETKDGFRPLSSLTSSNLSSTPASPASSSWMDTATTSLRSSSSSSHHHSSSAQLDPILPGLGINAELSASKLASLARELCVDAAVRGSSDNLTALVICLHPEREGLVPAWVHKNK